MTKFNNDGGRTTMLTVDDFNRAIECDRAAMKAVDDAVMIHCRGELTKYQESYSALFNAAKLAAPPPAAAGPRPIQNDDELDGEIRAVVAEENVSYYDAFVILGNRRDRQRETRRAGQATAAQDDPTKPAAVCKCCSGPKVPAEKACACPTRKSPTECACQADCSICISLACGGVNAQARAVVDRIFDGAARPSSSRRRAMCPFDQPIGHGARIVALREDCEYCRSGRPHPWQSGPAAA